jgi:hypothetical protein
MTTSTYAANHSTVKGQVHNSDYEHKDHDTSLEVNGNFSPAVTDAGDQIQAVLNLKIEEPIHHNKHPSTYVASCP